MFVGWDADQKSFAREAGKLARDLSANWDRGRSPADVAWCEPSAADWRRIVEAGWLALRVNEEAGGGGGTTVDACVLAEQLGYHVVPAAVLGTIIVLEQLQVRGADSILLESIASGEIRATTTLADDLRDFASPDDVTAIAVDAAGVDTALVLGDREAIQVQIQSAATGADVTRALGRIDAVAPIRRHSLNPDTSEARARALAFAITLVSADMLGVMQAALDAAVAHARVREQFGSPIGSFQAIQHIAAECLVSVEATRSAVWYAAWALDEVSPIDALEAARTTKAFASVSVIEVVEAAIQIFGGIGMTWESPAHIWQRRAHLDRRLFGDEDAQYAQLAQQSTTFTSKG